MGACSGKLSDVQGLAVSSAAKVQYPVSEKGIADVAEDAVSQAHGRNSPCKSKASPINSCTEAQPAASNRQHKPDRPASSHEVGLKLRRSAEFWKGEGRPEDFSDKELVDLYKRDNLLLLDSMQRIEETVRNLRGSSTPVSSSRAQDDKRQSAKPINCDNGTFTSSEGLSPSTPRGVLDVRFSDRSDDTSPWPAEAPRPSPFAELGRNSVTWLLERDPPGEEIAADFEGGRMLGAYTKLEAWCRRHSLDVRDMEPRSGALGFDVAELWEHHRVIQKASTPMLKCLREEEGYSVARDDGDLRLLYKQIKGTSVHCIKMNAVLSCPLEHALALAREFDLMSEWNSYVLDSTLLAAPTIWQSWVYGATWMPFPFPQMDAIAEGRGYDLCEEDKCLLVMMRSVEEASLPKGCKPLPKKAAKRKRVTVLEGSCIRFEALPPAADGSPRTRGTVLAHVDPHLPHVPAFLVTFVLSVLAPFAHRMIKQLLRKDFKDPSKPFPQRMAAQPELYDRARAIVAEGLRKFYGVGDTVGDSACGGEASDGMCIQMH